MYFICKIFKTSFGTKKTDGGQCSSAMLTCYHWTTYKHAVSLTFSACICICICSDNSPFYALSATCRPRKMEHSKYQMIGKTAHFLSKEWLLLLMNKTQQKKKNPPLLRDTCCFDLPWQRSRAGDNSRGPRWSKLIATYLCFEYFMERLWITKTCHH